MSVKTVWKKRVKNPGSFTSIPHPKISPMYRRKPAPRRRRPLLGTRSIFSPSCWVLPKMQERYMEITIELEQGLWIHPFVSWHVRQHFKAENHSSALTWTLPPSTALPVHHSTHCNYISKQGKLFHMCPRTTGMLQAQQLGLNPWLWLPHHD